MQSIKTSFINCGHSIFNVCKIEKCESEFTFLVGKNGAGKTSLLNSWFSNKSEFFSTSVYYVQQSLERKSPICQSLLSIEFLTLGENSLKFTPSNLHIEALKAFEIENIWQKPIGTLSGGEWKKLQLAKAWLSDSSIFFLDEPTSALDIISQKKFPEVWTKKPVSKNKNVWTIIVSHENKDKLCNFGNVYEVQTSIVNSKNEILVRPARAFRTL